ncbi:hypothetical protein GYMLUDRAFT_138525, partial [Collybiopsis luxurians FD-317 M1]
LTQMVNLLSTKLELGSPMICLYLLQNPDHYCSHQFVLFYWKSFVLEAQSYWLTEDPRSDNKVVLIWWKGKLIGLSLTFNYMHRPKIHDQYNLYKCLRQFKRVKKPRKKWSSHPIPSDNKENASDDQPPLKEDLDLCFTSGHLLQSSHIVSVTWEFKRVVPNFLGSPLPHPDKGDQEYYCCSMLTFFKPWRSGKDLKTENQTWSEAFDTFQFNEVDLLHMKNMNLHYKCLDLRDDFQAKL